MKRILLLSAMIISSFGMINLQTVAAAPQQSSQDVTNRVNAKKLVSGIHKAVNLQGDQFSKVNDICVDYFAKLDELNKAKPADLDAKVTSLKATRNTQIKALLTPAQLKAWSSFKD